MGRLSLYFLLLTSDMKDALANATAVRATVDEVNAQKFPGAKARPAAAMLKAEACKAN